MEERIGRYIDPLSDYGFKRLFGSEPSKDLLIDFLNELFAGQRRIVDLTYKKTEHLGEDESIAKAVFDLLCTDENGNYLLI